MPVHFIKDATDHTIRSPLFPYRVGDDRGQFVGETAGGTDIIQGLRAAKKEFTLRFKNLTDTEKGNLYTFWTTTVDGASTTFTYTDPESNNFTVRWMNKTFGFQMDLKGRWSGEITLKDES